MSSLATASSQAFNPDRLQPYRDALDATRALEQSFAADSARAGAALASGRRRDLRRRGKGGATRGLGRIEDPHGRNEAEARPLRRGGALLPNHSAAEARRYPNKPSVEEYAAELAALQRQDALGEQSLAAKQRVDDMLIEATRRRDDQMAALTRSALQQEQRDYQAFGNSIAQAFNSQLRGLLTGTTTWHTAFKSVLDDLLIKFIEWCETSVEHYALAEAMKTAATMSGVAARTSAEEGGAAASLGAQGAAMVRSILSSAAEAFAGVFGFLAPLMGPFAAGPAAAAQATVAGMAGAVASADIGMWRAPQDMLTLVHHNELIMPPAEAGAFRSMLSTSASGGASPSPSVAIHPTTHFNVSAIDGASVASWMRSNGAGMARALDEAVRHGAALGLKRLRG